jgi:hypothetical protein
MVLQSYSILIVVLILSAGNDIIVVHDQIELVVGVVMCVSAR